jgi:probable FeS assembly SUF system protein SufT
MSDNTEPEKVKLTRDVKAILVPFGEEITLEKDTEVTITQSLGGAYTIVTAGQMFRISNLNADALGKEPVKVNENLAENATLEDKIWAALKTCYDPEIPVNIVDLGLIYSIEIQNVTKKTFAVLIKMTLTAPGCGMGPVIAADAKQKVFEIAGVVDVDIEFAFDPPWDRSRMSEAAKLQLGMI